MDRVYIIHKGPLVPLPDGWSPFMDFPNDRPTVTLFKHGVHPQYKFLNRFLWKEEVTGSFVGKITIYGSEGPLWFGTGLTKGPTWKGYRCSSDLFLSNSFYFG